MITGSTFQQNSAGSFSGYNVSVGSAAVGGAIYTQTIFGSLLVSTTAFQGNFARCLFSRVPLEICI